MVLCYLLLAPCLSPINSSTLYWPTDYPYCTQLSSTGPLPVSMVLYYLLLAPCLSLWYSTIFYWLPSYPCGTLSSTVPLPIPLLLYYLPSAHAGFLTIPLVLYYRLLASCLSLWYSTIFYWPNAYTYGILLSSAGSLLIPMVLYVFYYPTAYTYGLLLSSNGPAYPLGTLLSSSGPLPVDLCLYMGFLIGWRIVYSRALHGEL